MTIQKFWIDEMALNSAATCLPNISYLSSSLAFFSYQLFQVVNTLLEKPIFICLLVGGCVLVGHFVDTHVIVADKALPLKENMKPYMKLWLDYQTTDFQLQAEQSQKNRWKCFWYHFRSILCIHDPNATSAWSQRSYCFGCMLFA